MLIIQILTILTVFRDVTFDFIVHYPRYEVNQRDVNFWPQMISPRTMKYITGITRAFEESSLCTPNKKHFCLLITKLLFYFCYTKDLCGFHI